MQETTPAALADWVGREESRADRLDHRPTAALAATLDLAPEAVLAEGVLPPLWHWVHFTPLTRSAELGSDGHPARGGFLPPVELPNRMWAGGRLRFLRPLALGAEVERRSRILRCERKQGRSGELVFVTVAHSIAESHSTGDGPAIEEEQDIVYRQPAPRSQSGQRPAGESAPDGADYRIRRVPDPVLLFRYSALTFNSHRIHYDQPYTTGEEGYPGLVVHGPLTATLLLQAYRQTHPARRIERFAFRALGPLHAGETVDFCGRDDAPGHSELWSDIGGRLGMRAEVEYSVPAATRAAAFPLP